MGEKVIPLFKSNYSISKSILTLDPPGGHVEGGSDSIFDIANECNIDSIFMVEDSISSFLPAYLGCKSSKKKFRFGLRMNFVSDLSVPYKEDISIHKNIVFCKNEGGYKRLIKLSTLASTKNFDTIPRFSYENLHDLWSDDDLILGVPFYDSFLFNNTLTKSICVPSFGKIKPVFFVEDNDLPFDSLAQNAVYKFCESEGNEVCKAKSIFYKNRDDFYAWQTYKLINRKSFGSGNTLEKPNLEHCGSREFCIESWRSYV